MKKKACFEIFEEQDVSKYKNIGFDKTIKMTGFYKLKDCPYKLRVIESYNPETDKKEPFSQTIIIGLHELILLFTKIDGRFINCSISSSAFY